MSKAKRRIHKFDFKGEGAHVALVDKAANLQEVLSMKAAEGEVSVTLSMKEFLTKFFNLWSEDATILAGILGYSTESNSVESYDDFIQGSIDKVSLLKSEDSLESIESLPESIYNKVEELQKQFGDEIMKTSEDSPLEGNINIDKGESQVGDTKIKTEELELLKSQAEEAKELKAQLEELETIKSQVAELKTYKALAETLKQEKAEKAKAEMVEVVKGYSFVTEDAQDELVDFLLKSEGSQVILSVLEKARDAISEGVSVEQETGSEADGELLESYTDKSIELTAQILKSRKA